MSVTTVMPNLLKQLHAGEPCHGRRRDVWLGGGADAGERGQVAIGFLEPNFYKIDKLTRWKGYFCRIP